MRVHQKVASQFQVIPNEIRAHDRGKITCTTCQLKKCIGRCHWEMAPTRKAA